jgi:hypothetical protein
MADRSFTVVVERCGVVTLRDEPLSQPVRDGPIRRRDNVQWAVDRDRPQLGEGHQPRVAPQVGSRAWPVHARRP